MTDEFRALLRRGLDATGSQKKLAEVLGLSKQRINNALAGRGYAFGVLNCLILARLIQERDWIVLRAAEKGAIADLLETSYGRRRIRSRTSTDPLARLTHAERTHILAVVEDLERARKSHR